MDKQNDEAIVQSADYEPLQSSQMLTNAIKKFTEKELILMSVS